MSTGNSDDSIDSAAQRMKRAQTMQTLTPSKKREMKEIFNLFDMDGSGSIDEQELRVVLRAMGYNLKPQEIADLIAENIGEVDDMELDDFICDNFIKGQSGGESQLRIAFKLFSGDGKTIKLKDLRRIAKELGDDITDEELQMMMTETDMDNDGEINEDEWIKVMTGVRMDYEDDQDNES